MFPEQETAGSAESQIALSAPSISLRKGGNTIHSQGENFKNNPETGTGSMTVPIEASLGRSGLIPQPERMSASGTGNGLIGFGSGCLSLPFPVKLAMACPIP